MIKLLPTALLSAVLALAQNASMDSANADMKAGKYAEAMKTLEAELKAKPKDPAIMKALADASFAQGTRLMNDEKLPPGRKYPASLRAFRQAAALDPSNRKAAENVKMIEGIYKSMGRPIPE